MKKVVIISFLLGFLLGCEKDTELKHPEYIIAGKTEGSDIKYSGIINDTLVFDYPSSSASRSIDINDDGIFDFKLSLSGSASPGSSYLNNTISPIGNGFLVVPEPGGNVIDTILFSDTINGELNWSRDGYILYQYRYQQYMNTTSATGLWKKSANKYIGAGVLIDNNMIFGWIRVEMTSGWSMTLVDYACAASY